MDKAKDDAAVFGATPESIAAAHGPVDADCHVWAENWPAWRAFLSVQTQWITGMSGPTGLDYGRVEAGLRMAGVQVTPELFDKLHILERAVLQALSTKEKSPET
jgi:hypothetical protein